MSEITSGTNAGNAGGRGKRVRLSSQDSNAFKEFLSIAYLAIDPEEQTQRRVFEALMPEMYALRKKGCSFAQITGLLGQAGFRLQPSTVRSYYNEMITEKMAACEKHFSEQLVILNQINRASAGKERIEAARLAETVLQVRERKKAAAEVQAQALLTRVTGESQGSSAIPASAPLASLPAKQAARPAPEARAAEVAPAAPAAPESGFGLLPTAEAPVVEVAPGGGFFDVADPAEPVIPMLSPKTPQARAPAPSPAISKTLKCAALQAGIEPIPKRAGVPPEVYENKAPMEHPAIPGLMLSKEQRTYGALLEVIDEDGAIRTETLDEKRYRLKWQRPIPAAETSTKGNFVEMRQDIFGPERTEPPPNGGGSH